MRARETWLFFMFNYKNYKADYSVVDSVVGWKPCKYRLFKHLTTKTTKLQRVIEIYIYIVEK